MKLIDKINNAANEYNKTKDEKYKKEWYKLIKEYAAKDYKGYSIGGLASLTRTTPPERGPQYRGLDYLRKHGRGY